MKRIQLGYPVSKGIGIGSTVIYRRYVPIKKIEFITQQHIQASIQRYYEVIQKAHDEIEGIKHYLEKEADDKAMIFAAHLSILHDIALEEMVLDLIKNKHYSLAYAMHEAFDVFINMLHQVDNPYIRERVTDLVDVKNRVLRISEGLQEISLSYLQKPTVVVSDDLYPSEIAILNRKFVEAIIVESGGITSHTAIIAKSYGIPTILGAKGIIHDIESDTQIIVDALDNQIILNPDFKILEEYHVKKRNYQDNLNKSKTYLTKKAETKDQKRIEVCLNVDVASDEELSYASFVDGVGLLRSEYLYMHSDHLPNEEEQYHYYAKVLKAYGNKPVILRTLDIGGDKQLPYMPMPEEENPCLGLRAIRFCFEHPEILKSQLRAAFRASTQGNLWLMFPMVSTLDDIDRMYDFIDEVKSSLEHEKIPFNHDVKIGVMMEIPSLFLLSHEVAKRVDFASIGTNDLCQYLHAVDRQNQLVETYYQSYSPAMFRMIKIAVDAFKHEQKTISVCGELANDPIALPILLGLGVEHLSMSKSFIATTKQAISMHHMTEFIDATKHVLTLSKEKDIVSYMKSCFKLDI